MKAVVLRSGIAELDGKRFQLAEPIRLLRIPYSDRRPLAMAYVEFADTGERDGAAEIWQPLARISDAKKEYRRRDA